MHGIHDVHQRLFASDPQKTPKSYYLTQRQRTFYTAFKLGKRGFAASFPGEKDPEAMLATFVLALYQTVAPDCGDVAIVVTPATEQWYQNTMVKAFRQAVRVRCEKKIPKEGMAPLVEAMGRIYLASRPLQMSGPPERWVCYGFTPDCQPGWIQTALI